MQLHLLKQVSHTVGKVSTDRQYQKFGSTEVDFFCTAYQCENLDAEIFQYLQYWKRPNSNWKFGLIHQY